MPSPKDGTAGTLVCPADPTDAKPADDAVPGEVETVKAAQRESCTGKYGTTPIPPYKPPQTEEEAAVKTSWIEIKLVDKNQNPVAGAKYIVKLKDGTADTGTLDGDGFARVDGIEPGTADITFPEYAPNSWDPA